MPKSLISATFFSRRFFRIMVVSTGSLTPSRDTRAALLPSKYCTCGDIEIVDEVQICKVLDLLSNLIMTSV